MLQRDRAYEQNETGTNHAVYKYENDNLNVEFFEQLTLQSSIATAEELAQHVAKEGKILDVGTRTGLCGDYLTRLGYWNIEGVDNSIFMIDEARRRNVYGKLMQSSSSHRLDFPDNHFDAVICATGLLTEDSDPDLLLEMARVTKRMGVVIFATLPGHYLDERLKTKVRNMQEEGLWQLMSITDGFTLQNSLEINVLGQVWVYGVSSS